MSSAHSSSSRTPWVIPGILLGTVASLLLMHYPMIFSGLHRMQADIGDSRLNNFFLEHTYRWITGRDARFWTPAFFYPLTNTLAYSDLMLSFAPFYCCWRWIGFEPDTAFQLWMMLGTILNFGVALYWLRDCCKCSWFGAVAGAVFFAVAGPRATQLGHQQLQWQVFPMLAIVAVFKIFQPDQAKPGRWWMLLSLSIAGQFWGGFYIGWFLMLSLAIAAMVAILWRSWRKQLVVIIRRDAATIAIAVVITAALLAPVASKYLTAMKEVGGHPYEEVQLRLATPAAWAFPGPFSLERAWASRWVQVPEQKFERAISIGIITTCLAVLGLWFNRRGAGMAPLVIVSIAIVCLGTSFEGRSLWWLAFNSVPGASAIRAPARIGLLLLIPASLGLACFINQFQNRRRIAVVLAVAACLLEQATILPSYDKQQARDRIAAITAAIPRDAKCFFYLGDDPVEQDYAQIDAMWAGQISGVPTINGYSGSTPTGWEMMQDVLCPPSAIRHERKLREAAGKWAALWSIDASDVVWLRQTTETRVCQMPSPAITAGVDTKTVP